MSANLVKSKRASAFTIVELLITIVVIGILATISIVTYNGISNRAAESNLQSDLTNASKQLGMVHAEAVSYPASLPAGAKASPGNSLHYTQESGGSGYCLSAVSGRSSARSFHISNTSGTVVEDSCPGHPGSGSGGEPQKIQVVTVGGSLPVHWPEGYEFTHLGGAASIAIDATDIDVLYVGINPNASVKASIKSLYAAGVPVYIQGGQNSSASPSVYMGLVSAYSHSGFAGYQDNWDFPVSHPANGNRSPGLVSVRAPFNLYSRAVPLAGTTVATWTLSGTTWSSMQVAEVGTPLLDGTTATARLLANSVASYTASDTSGTARYSLMESSLAWVAASP
ncbi:hypothetical protein B7Y94_03690 [Candidatus Saccharibacteria bacterium 32-49-12]|nr:MAG: hypothetical protein B7Y94_03690 [Candidatus Saccharibacteria bacterium 32-49-12]